MHAAENTPTTTATHRSFAGNWFGTQLMWAGVSFVMNSCKSVK